MRSKKTGWMLLATLLLVAAATAMTALSTADAHGTSKESHQQSWKIESANPPEPVLPFKIVNIEPQDSPQPQQIPDPPGTIDGNKHPERIPDQAAYLMLFRLVANRYTDVERESIKTRIRQAGLGKLKCKDCDQNGDEADVDKLIAAAEEFKQRVDVLDSQAAAIKQREWPDPSPEVMQQLTALQVQKENLIMEIAGSLKNRLSKDGFGKLDKHVKQTMKRMIKATPGPSAPPRDNGWQHHQDGDPHAGHH